MIGACSTRIWYSVREICLGPIEVQLLIWLIVADQRNEVVRELQNPQIVVFIVPVSIVGLHSLFDEAVLVPSIKGARLAPDLALDRGWLRGSERGSPRGLFASKVSVRMARGAA